MEEKGGYQGPERRRYQRRENPDRRAMVRYEPDKTPRRRLADRRRAASVWDGRERF
ncbi:hypothetical protein [Inmirania thermothiophila]|uniref:Uncharacterized protein n=1 Tax=Inmirania thermothiophila TaxID=1750597 RepID=A0A3N1Y132_9GAMM|nr:hypothetical protein [Inmirania thermothiophila]ROR32544.1 hypothetical protein EDC57_1746 [Inmirania thermothiophila]